VGALLRPPSAALFIHGQLPLLAQADFEESQKESPADPEGDQADGKHLAGQSVHEHGADRADEDEHAGRPERQDA
jgi:hypothetical protein